MGVKVYYSEISANKEVKKRQQRVMMILESKQIPYESIDITEAGREADKTFMLSNAKPRGESKFIQSPQIFNDDLYCGDYDDFDLANENDVLEKFLNTPKIESNVPGAIANGTQNGNAGSREPSAESELKPETIVVPQPEPENLVSSAESKPDEHDSQNQPTEENETPAPAQSTQEIKEDSQIVPEVKVEEVLEKPLQDEGIEAEDGDEEDEEEEKIEQ